MSSHRPFKYDGWIVFDVISQFAKEQSLSRTLAPNHDPNAVWVRAEEGARSQFRGVYETTQVGSGPIGVAEKAGIAPRSGKEVAVLPPKFNSEVVMLRR
jgi:hypothetical protein